MARLIDVAQYVCDSMGEITSMKLQKLIYYCQAWSLVWDDQPLFENEIQAWVYGPVIPDLYVMHRKMFKINADIFKSMGSDSNRLNDTEKDTINAVLGHYGDKTSQWLIELSHQEKPWIDARESLDKNERGNNTITLESMMEYYGSL